MNGMNITGLLTDDDAVAPVIAVVLMVAITVVLAAIIATFVIGVGGEQNEAPNVVTSFEFDGSTGAVSIVHDGGSDVEASRLSVEETGSTDGVSVNAGTSTFTSSDEIASGNYENGETIKLVWFHPESKTTAVLGQDTAPS